MAPPRRPVMDRLMEQVLVNGGLCWIWQGARDKDGYGIITIGRGHQFRCHRVAYELLVGKIPKGKMVCHTCDIPVCCNPNHLYIGDAKSNARDRAVRGRNGNLSGYDHPNAKLMRSDIKEIRRMRNKDKMTLTQIAKAYNISFQHVSAICLNRVRVHS